MLRNAKSIIGLGLLAGGLIILAFASLGHIGYALYMWADNVELATALWTAFKSWILFLIIGFITAVLGSVLTN